MMLRVTQTEALFLNVHPFVSFEAIYNLNDVGSTIERGFQQTRLSIGGSQKWNSQFTTEYAFMKNHIQSKAADDQDNNVLQINFAFNF
jgi:hypothetical protein